MFCDPTSFCCGVLTGGVEITGYKTLVYHNLLIAFISFFGGL